MLSINILVLYASSSSFTEENQKNKVILLYLIIILYTSHRNKTLFCECIKCIKLFNFSCCRLSYVFRSHVFMPGLFVSLLMLLVFHSGIFLYIQNKLKYSASSIIIIIIMIIIHKLFVFIRAYRVVSSCTDKKHIKIYSCAMLTKLNEYQF